VAKRCWGGGGAAGLGSAVGAVFWRGVTHVGGRNQKMWLCATLQICLGRASRMARAAVRENAELETRVAKRCWGGGGAAGLGSAVRAVFWRGVTHVGGCNQKMWLYVTLQICLGRASRMARAGVRENAELETRVAKWC
jgi:chemotaxis receptor (MCP) glutamine deamidase CheD